VAVPEVVCQKNKTTSTATHYDYLYPKPQVYISWTLYLTPCLDTVILYPRWALTVFACFA
jgi:hypothetical protein